MARFDELARSPLGFASLQGLPMQRGDATTGFIARVLATTRAWWHLSQSRHQLAELDDYQLKDMGLSRAQVVTESDKFFWQR